MLREGAHYLRWWVSDVGSNRIVIVGPLLVVFGTVGVAWSLVDADLGALGVTALLLAFGLFFMLGPMLRFLGQPKPWRGADGSRESELRLATRTAAQGKSARAAGSRFYLGTLIALSVIWSSVVHPDWFQGTWLALWFFAGCVALWLIAAGGVAYRRGQRGG